MDKVSNKLASLKGRLLNKPGCVTLTNSVLTAIPAYSMQTQWLPRYVCDHLDKTVRSFIWKGSTNKGMHMVGWEKITKSKKNGGLGVRTARKQNIALLGKLVWDMFKPSNHLWSQILSARYLQGSNIFLTRNSKGSPIWNAIVKTLKVLEDGFHFKIGNGTSSMWYEPWLLKDPLCHLVPFVQIQDIDLQIRDIITRDGGNLQNVYTMLSQDVRSKILETTSHLVDDVTDNWIWNNCTSGAYSAKSAYS